MTDDGGRLCSHCGKAVSAIAQFCQICGQPCDTPPTAPAGLPTPVEQGDATGGVIPYKNPPALFAYYCGVFSILPFFPLGIAALVLGIYGLKKANRHPVVKGRVHAWIGIIVGGFFGLVWTAVTVMIVVRFFST